VQDGAASISAVSTVTASGELKWNSQGDASTSWSDQAAATKTWTNQTSASTDWSEAA